MSEGLNMRMSLGVAGLLSQAHRKSPFEGARYFFKGDLCQMSKARQVAWNLEIACDVEGGIPFVTSEDDFERVKQYLIDHRVEGWWNYVTYEERCRITGEYTFGGKYLRLEKEIQQIADELGIFIQRKPSSDVLFASSKKDFDAIVKKLDATGTIAN